MADSKLYRRQGSVGVTDDDGGGGVCVGVGVWGWGGVWKSESLGPKSPVITCLFRFSGWLCCAVTIRSETDRRWGRAVFTLDLFFFFKAV